MLKFTSQRIRCPAWCVRRGIHLLAIAALGLSILLLCRVFLGFSKDDEVQTRNELTCAEPSKESEDLLRRLQSDNRLLWGYVKAQRRLLDDDLENADQVDGILENLSQYLRITRHKLDLLREADGRGAWRRQEAEDLSELVQHRLRVLQHPEDCNSARKLYCKFSGWSRGIGSQLHHLTFCFVAAYATQRTLILDTEGWYNTSRGLDEFFLPLSNSCASANLSEMVPWPGTDSLLVEFPANDYPQPFPPYFPRSVPKDISERLARLHGDPFAWWVGQFFQYAMRMNSHFEEYIRHLALRIGFERPIVGIQIRRTDKMTNGLTFIPLKTFMDAVAEFYDDLELRQKVRTRRVFVATDDPSVIKEAKEKYPDYQFVYMEESIASADMQMRRSDVNLRYYMADTYFLSRSSYLVCTMTSNLCRLTYEIMQTLHDDAAAMAKMLELPLHHIHREKVRLLQAQFSHTPLRRDEMAMEAGDLITVKIRSYSTKHYDDDGFLTGTNLNRSKGGLFPLYKTTPLLRVEEFPSYDHIDRMK
ncbi:alpha-(1,6)-fucosyltransferase [Penaeus vannamei]|uniref:alpha-(1,6)-fucosyltransferase n=1 Tax=Penaeus vannamei TaxID=6689 RepID=UPI00387F672F